MLKIADWPPFSTSAFSRQRYFCTYDCCAPGDFHMAWCPRFTPAEQAEAREAPTPGAPIDIVLE